MNSAGKMLQILFLFLVLSVPVTGCAGPTLTKRYATMQNVEVGPETIETRLTAFSMRVFQPSAETTLLRLSGRGQASLIRVLGQKTGNSSDFLHSLGNPVERLKTFRETVDHTIVKRRVVLSVDHWPIKNPADRIRRAEIRLTNLTGGAEFSGWNQVATRYETVNLGQVAFTRQNGIGLGLSVPSGGFAGITANVQDSQSLREKLQLSRRYAAVTGTLLPERAELIEEGAPGIDLTGNLIVDLTIHVRGPSNHYDTFSFGPLVDAGGRLTMPNRIVIVRQTHIFTPDPKEIDADAVLTATVRRVKKGGSTLFEGDDDVVFATGNRTVRHVLLVPVDCFRFSVWMLTGPGGYPLTISSGASQPETVFFSSYDGATAFRDYLVRTGNPSFVGNLRLWVHESPLNSGVSGQLQVEMEKVNWR